MMSTRALQCALLAAVFGVVAGCDYVPTTEPEAGANGSAEVTQPEDSSESGPVETAPQWAELQSGVPAADAWQMTDEAATATVVDGGADVSLPASALMRLVFDQPVAIGDSARFEAEFSGGVPEGAEVILYVSRFGGRTQEESKITRCELTSAPVSCVVEHTF